MIHPAIDPVINPALAMLGVVGLFAWMLFRPGSTAPAKIFLLIAAWMAFGPISEAIMNAENAAHPWKLDYHLFLIDKSLGVSAFAIARHFTAPQQKVLFVIYGTLGYWMFALYGLNLKMKDGRPRELAISYLLSYGLAPIFYLVVPACGPRHAFGAMFPLGSPEVAAVPIQLNYWPNAIPSLHLATAVLLVHFAGRNGFWRTLAWLYLAGTAAATLVLEHYVIDLVVAVPYAYFVICAAERKVAPALGNLVLVLGWLISIRLATPAIVSHPLLLMVASGLTVLAGAFSMHSFRIGPETGVIRPPANWIFRRRRLNGTAAIEGESRIAG